MEEVTLTHSSGINIIGYYTDPLEFISPLNEHYKERVYDDETNEFKDSWEYGRQYYVLADPTLDKRFIGIDGVPIIFSNTAVQKFSDNYQSVYERLLVRKDIMKDKINQTLMFTEPLIYSQVFIANKAE